MTYDSATKRRFVLVLGCLTAMGATAVDMSLAAIPSMSAALGTSVSAGQQIVGVFMLGMGLGQIPAGLMSDRIGRLPVIIAGITLFTVAAIASAAAPNIEFMLFARFVQGLGASVGMAVSRAVVRDIATGEEAARMLSIMVMVFTVGPMLAPIIGGYLVTHLGWRAPFGAVAVFGALALFLVLFFLEETGTPNRDQHPLRQLGYSAREFFSHRRSIFGMLLVVLTAMGFMTVISGASALIIGIYGYPPAHFGFIFACGALSVMAGSLLNRQLLFRLSTIQMAGIGAVLVGGGALQLLLIAWLGKVEFWWLWGSVCVYLAGFAFLVSNATAMALDPVPHVAGVAASLIGTLQNTFSAASAISAGLIYDGSVARSVFLMGFFGTVTLVVFLGRNLLLRRREASGADVIRGESLD